MTKKAVCKGVDATDLIGRVFSLLTVEKLMPRPQIRGRKYIYRYRCLCACGNTSVVTRWNLLYEHARSCGCLKRRRGSANPCWRGHGRISGYQWARIRNHARNRGLTFSITMKYAWDLFERQDGCCSLTGWKLALDLSSKSKSTCTASLDRINSKRGYVPGNVQWVHKDVNQIKWDLTSERFIEVCRAVVKHARKQ